MPHHYIRFQPVGVTLQGHTSECSDGSYLPSGYVFAYDNLMEVFGDWSPDCLRGIGQPMSVVTFYGSGAYNPGDAEGVAVLPGRIIRVETPEQFLRRIAAGRKSNAKDAAQALLDYYW